MTLSAAHGLYEAVSVGNFFGQLRIFDRIVAVSGARAGRTCGAIVDIDPPASMVHRARHVVADRCRFRVARPGVIRFADVSFDLPVSSFASHQVDPVSRRLLCERRSAGDPDLADEVVLGRTWGVEHGVHGGAPIGLALRRWRYDVRPIFPLCDEG